MDITVYLSPGFNLTATYAFLDPFIALNELDTAPTYSVLFVSDAGGPVPSHQGPEIETEDVDTVKSASNIVVISTSNAPEAAFGAPLSKHLRYWRRQDALFIGLETGAFVLADRYFVKTPACVHPLFAARFAAQFPAVGLSDQLYDVEGLTRTCAGGAASLDMAFSILAERHSADLVRSVRDFLIAPEVRPGDQRLTGGAAIPLSDGLPGPLKTAIATMRGSLDTAISVPTLAKETGLSQRQLERLFKSYTGRSPNQYYRMLRLDRAREMVTRTAHPMPDIAAACGFQSPVHFTRAYKEQFGRPPMRDRVRARIA